MHHVYVFMNSVFLCTDTLNQKDGSYLSDVLIGNSCFKFFCSCAISKKLKLVLISTI